MFGRKGQGAMEYLMTYGWAILVVMIVGIVMWQLGIFNLGGTAPTASGFSKIKPQLTSCKMTTGGTFTCLFTNGAGTAITLNSTTVKSGTTTCTPGVPGTSSVIVSMGDNFPVNATGCPTGVQGGPFSIDIVIAYNQSVAGTVVTRIDVGKIQGGYEA